MDPDKRYYRKLKRVVKRSGNRHRRRQLQRELERNPAEAAHSEESLGRDVSADLNGMDQDATRQRNGRNESEESP